MGLIKSIVAGLALALMASAALAQPNAFLNAPQGTTTYVTPNVPLPVLSETFSSTATGTLSATTSGTNLLLPGAGSLVQVTNSGSVTVFVTLGIGSGTAATTQSFAVPAGQVVYLNTYLQSVGLPATYIAGITASSTASLGISIGNITAAGGGGSAGNATIVGPLGPNTAANGVTVTPTAVPLISVDHSGTITAGGSFQLQVAAATARIGCTFQNPVSATEVLLFYAETAATPTLTTAFQLSPGSAISVAVPQGGVIQAGIYLEATTTGHAFIGSCQ